MSTRKHWTLKDFVEVRRYNGEFPFGPYMNRWGYCRKCYGDMQELSGRMGHYNSHGEAKRAGIDWKARAGRTV